MYNNNYPNGNVAPNYGPQNYGNPSPYNSVPPYYRPIKPWGYIGYMLLYGLPIIGFIMLIVNALAEDNINKRNYWGKWSHGNNKIPHRWEKKICNKG